MNKDFSKNTAKIISQKIEMDWIHPYKNKKEVRSIGTGFFIDNKGHLLTNSHVIVNSKKIYIELPYLGSKKIEVKIINLCPKLDIALLKTINFINEDYYEIYDKDFLYNLEIGCDAYVIGFPLGQDNIKITKGIISGRENSLIQTDTSINPGNSGGPMLVNNKVIGIVTSGIKNASNVSYATPISYYHLIKELLFNQKEKIIKLPFLGLIYQNSTMELNILNNNNKSEGIYVQKIFKNSPISQTGLKTGDLISSFNNISINNYGHFDKIWFNEKMKLDDILLTIKNNSIINIEFWRNNKHYKKQFKYNNYELTINTKYHIYEKKQMDYEVFGGLIIMELTNNHLNEILDSLSIKSIIDDNSINSKGNLLKFIDNENKTNNKLIITHIFPNSYVYNINILNDYDIIDKINNKNVSTLEDLRNSIKNNNTHIKIDTQLNKRIILRIKDLILNEPSFSNIYKYKLSNLYYFFKNKKKTKTTKNKTKTTKNKTKKLYK